MIWALYFVAALGFLEGGWSFPRAITWPYGVAKHFAKIAQEG